MLTPVVYILLLLAILLTQKAMSALIGYALLGLGWMIYEFREPTPRAPWKYNRLVVVGAFLIWPIATFLYFGVRLVLWYKRGRYAVNLESGLEMFRRRSKAFSFAREHALRTGRPVEVTDIFRWRSVSTGGTDWLRYDVSKKGVRAKKG